MMKSLILASAFFLGLTASAQVAIPGLPAFGFPAGGAAGGDGTSVDGNFSNRAGSRSYTAFIPSKRRANPGLLVVLHGCFMTGDQMAQGGLFNKYASDKNLIVLYPEQTYGDNAWKCFNWFSPDSQKRDSGEASILAGMVKQVMTKYKVDSNHVILTGISAGSAMASNLLGCYSDIFTGALLESGLEFAAAQSEDEAHQVMSTGPKRDLDASAKEMLKCSPARANILPVIVVHGSADPFVNPINATRTAQLFEKLNGLIFTGSADKITHTTNTIEQGGYRFSADVADTLYDGKLGVRLVMVKGMGHGWSGGQPVAPYMEPRGIDATKMLVDTFFQ